MGQFSTKMRIYHRYLGFFLAGIMAVYSLSGVILIFRETPFLKKNIHQVVQIKPNLEGEELGKALKIKGFKVDKINGDTVIFKQGTYLLSTGMADYTLKEYTLVVKKMTNLHKASTKSPLFYLNIFFGVSLFFFVVSSFWMFMPKTTIFRKSMYFTLAGIIVTLILLFI